MALIFAAANRTSAIERLVVQHEGQERSLSGKVIVEAEDGGLLVCTPDGSYWMIQPEQIRQRSSDDEPFRPLTADRLAEQLIETLPPGFRTYQTAHYVICYNTSLAYAQWCGSLFERLYRAFYAHWGHLQMPLHDPEFPLVALVFDSRESFLQFARGEIGDAAQSMIGYYNMLTNRMVMYDLTGIEGIARPGTRVSSASRINQILSQPAAEPTVATIVHEATHQLAYNSGLQTRFADNPFWVSEGLAAYFEVPDLRSSKGWSGIGQLNRRHWSRFRQYLSRRPADSLLTLLADDGRFRDPATSSDSYAEAWALTYFLLRTRKEEYVAYLKQLAQQPPLVEVGAEKRIAMFKAHFGTELEQLDRQMVRYIASRR